MNIGRKILIIGPNGSGKTTLGRKLAEITGLPYFELDYYFWKANWEETDDITFRNKVINLTSLKEWVIDGNYARNQDITLSACDTVIWLDVPKYTSIFRTLKRSAKRTVTKEPLWHNNTESFKRMFSKHSIITFAFFSYKRKKVRITKFRNITYKDKNWIIIRNNRELKKFWNELSLSMQHQQS